MGATEHEHDYKPKVSISWDDLLDEWDEKTAALELRNFTIPGRVLTLRGQHLRLLCRER